MEKVQVQEQLQEFQVEHWGPAPAQPSMYKADRSLPCEIDMGDICMPLTRERALGQQREMLEAFSAEAFQERLRRCERKYARGSAAFKREHQQLAMDVQTSIIPKYGFEGSLTGVAEMLRAARTFKDDPEVNRNIQTINRLAVAPSSPSSLREVRSRIAALHEDVWQQQQQEEHWQQYLQQQEFLRSRQQSGEELEQQQRPVDKLTFRGAPVELDMEDITVPLERERALALQKELYDKFSAPGFQAQLRECELRHAGEPTELLREHQQLVMGVQASVIPKYGFEPTLEGVLHMLAGARDFADDPEVSANVAAINGLIALKGQARPAPRQAGLEPVASKKAFQSSVRVEAGADAHQG